VSLFAHASLPIYAVGLALGIGLSGVGLTLAAPRRYLRSLWPTSATGRRRTTAIDLPSLVLATVSGVAAVAITGWPVAGLLAGIAVYGVPRLLRQTSAAASITTLEAIATWTEMLHGTLAASAGLGQAIMATADLSPAPIRGATEQLAAQIRSGVEPRVALLRFADEVADPCADRVVCSLLLAFSSRAQRLGELLSALAESTREEVSLRLRVETSRASVRSGVRTVVVFSVAFAALLAVFARSYLAPFGTASGQLILLAVGGLYAAGLILMVALARPPRAIRLLGSEVEEQ